MKKKELKKLTLTKETLLSMDGSDLRRAIGGAGWSDDSVCPTSHPQKGTPPANPHPHG